MKTLLIIEDDYAQMEMLAFLFEGDGFRALRASNGEEALALIASTAMPDLVITDVLMPVMNGERFVESLRALPNGRSVPIVVVTTNGIPAALAQEAVAIVRKPYLYETLLGIVSRTLTT